MKQLAARDWEDLLQVCSSDGRAGYKRVTSILWQCIIPAFEGLLPDDHGNRVLNLLFIFAYWHSLVKLRIHTDRNLAILDRWTVMLGEECRKFCDKTCAAIHTLELRREYEARPRERPHLRLVKHERKLRERRQQAQNRRGQPQLLYAMQVGSP